MTVWVLVDSGNNRRTGGYSPSTSRLVVRRPPASKPTMSAPCAREISTEPEPAMFRATSDRVRARTKATCSTSGEAGDQVSWRMARRYRSVASSVNFSPSISMRTPVSSGSVSSRPAAMVTWLMASANRPPSMLPWCCGISGSSGYSPVGMVSKVNRAEPHRSSTLLPSRLTSMGLFGSDREISASSRPSTSTVPGSLTSAGTEARAETS